MMVALLCIAAKLPSAHDGFKEVHVDDGRQRYPVKLYGVAIKWDKSCRKGKTTDCLKLARALEDGLGDLKRDMRSATGYWIISCNRGSAKACARSATILREGLGGFTKPERASTFAAKGCQESKDGAACASLAVALYRGDGVTRNKAQALALWRSSCSQGTDDGCRLQAGALYNESNDTADHRQAIALFKSGCADDSTWACTGLAQAYAAGKGVTKNTEKSTEYARRACFSGSGDTVAACGLYGRYLTQSSDPKQVGLGTKLLSRSCLAGVATACNDAGLVAGRQPVGSGLADWEEALSFRDGCDLRLAEACHNLAKLYRDGGVKVKQDKGSALALFDAACKGGVESACSDARTLTNFRADIPKINPAFSTEAQLAKAVEAVKSGQGTMAYNTVVRLMQEAAPEAEWLLGGWFYYGQPGVIETPNKRNGTILIENAARQGHVEASVWTGMAYWYGDGFAQNRRKGEAYMKQAANRGNEMAAAILRSMKNEPIREDRARAAAEAQKRDRDRKNDWGNWIAAASRQWAASASRYAAPVRDPMAGSWARFNARQDRTNFNNAMRYYSGSSGACPSFNKYC